MKWLNASDALAILGTKPQTLYANVSRGRIRSRPDPKDSRKSLYAEQDVQKLAAKSHGRRSSDIVASGTIRWGDPVLSSAISTVVNGRLYYRGRDAVELAKAQTFENVAGLLWQLDPVFCAAEKKGEHLLSAVMLAMAVRASADASVLGRSSAVLRREANLVFCDVASHLAGAGDAPVHQRLANLWQRPEASAPIKRALVLLADHELNASTFAARIASSTGASLAASVLTGLCTLSGPLHGGAAAAVRSLVKQTRDVGAKVAVRERLAEGRALPGFGHPLYPDGDIRAKALLETLDLPPFMVELKAEAEETTGEFANVDFALLALRMAFDLPEDAPLHLFALARTAGWLAHALEQAETGHLIRPRARYVGRAVQPEKSG